eukprot:scaffold79311_cov28-Tisochrysis_lutea.AAC.3
MTNSDPRPRRSETNDTAGGSSIFHSVETPPTARRSASEARNRSPTTLEVVGPRPVPPRVSALCVPHETAASVVSIPSAGVILFRLARTRRKRRPRLPIVAMASAVSPSIEASSP